MHSQSWEKPPDYAQIENRQGWKLKVHMPELQRRQSSLSSWVSETVPNKNQKTKYVEATFWKETYLI